MKDKEKMAFRNNSIISNNKIKVKLKLKSCSRYSLLAYSKEKDKITPLSTNKEKLQDKKGELFRGTSSDFINSIRSKLIIATQRDNKNYKSTILVNKHKWPKYFISICEYYDETSIEIISNKTNRQIGEMMMTSDLNFFNPYFSSTSIGNKNDSDDENIIHLKNKKLKYATPLVDQILGKKDIFKRDSSIKNFSYLQILSGKLNKFRSNTCKFIDFNKTPKFNTIKINNSNISLKEKSNEEKLNNEDEIVFIQKPRRKKFNSTKIIASYNRYIDNKEDFKRESYFRNQNNKDSSDKFKQPCIFNFISELDEIKDKTNFYPKSLFSDKFSKNTEIESNKMSVVASPIRIKNHRSENTLNSNNLINNNLIFISKANREELYFSLPSPEAKKSSFKKKNSPRKNLSIQSSTNIKLNPLINIDI